MQAPNRQQAQHAIDDLNTGLENGPTYSSLSLASIVFGLLSPLLIVFCFTSLITSLIAIVCGHKALSKIKSSRGTLTGHGSALTGVSLGYVSLALTILLGGTFIAHVANTAARRSAEQQASDNTSASGRLANAEATIRAKSTVGTGNNAQASEIALELATAVQSFYAAAAAENGETLGSDDSFRVYCEMHPGTCAILVYVPDYRGYSSKDKAEIADMFWMLSRKMIAGKLKHGDRIAVGLRGRILYGDVMLGRYSVNDKRNENYSRGEPKDLLAFFEPEAALAPAPVEVANSTPPKTPRAVPNQAVPPKRDILVPASAAPKVTPYEDLQPTTTVSSESKALPPDDPFLNIESNDADSSPDAPPPLGPDAASTSSASESAKPNFVNQLVLEKHTEIVSKGSLIWTITFINKDKWLCVGKMNRTLTTYDLSTGKELWKSDRLNDLMVFDSVESSPTGDAVFVKDRRGDSIAMKVNQDGSLEKTRTLSGHSFSPPMICASPAHPFVATGSHDGNIVWQPYTGNDNTQRSLQAFKHAVQDIHLPSRGIQALATDGNELVKFSLKDSSIISKQQITEPAAGGARFNRTGERVLMKRNESLTEHDVKQGKQLQTFSSVDGPIKSFDYHPSQPWVTASNSRSITIWDASTAQPLAFFNFEDDLRGIDFAKVSEDRLLVCCPRRRNDKIQIYRIAPTSN